MNKRGNRSDARHICYITLGMIIVGGGLSAPAVAGAVFTWDPGAAVPSLGGPFTADAIDATHNLFDRCLTVDCGTYTVHFLEPITGFTLNGAPVHTPGLNGTPGAPGSYGLYLVMQNQTRFVGPPSTYHYLSGTVALMLDPGNNDGTASSTPSGVGFSNTGPTGTADDITLASGSLVSGRFALGSTPNIRSIGDFVETFQPAAGEDGFVSPHGLIQVIDTTFVGDIVMETDPSDPSYSISVLNGGSTVIDFPVPEPASFLLLGCGLFGLFAVRARNCRPR